MKAFSVVATETKGPGGRSRWPRLAFPLLAGALMLVLGLSFLPSGGLFAPSHSGPWMDVSSVPQGAAVFVNGHLAGATPVRVADLTPGTYAVRLEKQGHEPVVVQVQLASVGVAVMLAGGVYAWMVSHMRIPEWQQIESMFLTRLRAR
jgi:hypothetical protein